jgi:hypothetical protein
MTDDGSLARKRRVHFACDCGASIVCFDISGRGQFEVACKSCGRNWELDLAGGTWVKRRMSGSVAIRPSGSNTSA